MVSSKCLLLLVIRNKLKGVEQHEFSFLRPQKGMRCHFLVLIKFFGCYMLRFMSIIMQFLALLLLMILNPFKGVGRHEFSFLRPQKGTRCLILVLIFVSRGTNLAKKCSPLIMSFLGALSI